MKLLASLFFAISVWAAATVVAPIPNGFRGKAEAPKTIDVSVISDTEAKLLFAKLKSDKQIPFKFALEGCYARATAMARIAEAQGLKPAKIFAEGRLQAQAAMSAFGTVQWGWHVAMIMYVKGATGEKKLMVFDPSLFDAPVTEEEWKLRMLDPASNYQPRIDEVYYGTRFQFFEKKSEQYKGAWLKQDLALSREVLKDFTELLKHPELFDAPVSPEIDMNPEETGPTYQRVNRDAGSAQ